MTRSENRSVETMKSALKERIGLAVARDIDAGRQWRHGPGSVEVLHGTHVRERDDRIGTERVAVARLVGGTVEFDLKSME